MPAPISRLSLSSLMTYSLAFRAEALREWQKLDPSIQTQFKKKLAERLEEPRIAAAKLHGHADRYKIKLRAAGYRLVYEVNDGQLVVLVIAVGKRDKDWVYRQLASR